MGLVDGEPKPKGITTQPEHRRIDGPKRGRHDDQEKPWVKEKGLTKIEMDEMTRTAGAAATETGQPSHPHKNALGQLEAG